MPILYENVLSKSPEKTVAVAKIKTGVGCVLFNETWVTIVDNTTQYIGTKILVVTTLYDEFQKPLDGKSVNVWHKLDTGAWEKIRTAIIGTTSDFGLPLHGRADIYYTLSKGGTHTFYVEFLGDDIYEGCAKGAVRAFVKCSAC